MFKKRIKNDTSSAFRHEFFDNVATIPVSDWETISEANLFLSLSYLQAIERSLSHTIDFKYILFYSNKAPVAIAVTQLLKFNTSDLSIQEFPCTISETIGNRIVQSLDVRVLVCGSLFTCGEHGFAHTDQIDAKEAFEMLAKTLRTLRKHDSKDKPSFLLLKEFWPQSVEESDILCNQKFRPVHIDVNMVLTIKESWNNFEDYLGSMKTKFRTRAKKVLTTSEGLIIKDFDHQLIVKYQHKINELYLSVIENADFKVTQLTSETFGFLKKTMKDNFMFKGYFLEEQLVGFSTAFIAKDAVEANHIGINYEFNVSHAIYQRMLYDYVELAIKHRVKSLRLGRTAELIKSSVGAQAVPMRLYVRHGNTVSNELLKPSVEFIQPSPYETRNPFKK